MKELKTLEELILYLKSVNGKVRAVPKIQKQMIIDATEYLSSASKISQRIYHLINDIKEIPKCKCCNNELVYKNISGYGKGFCSTKCYNKFRKEEKIYLSERRNDKKLEDKETYIKCEVCGEAVKSIAAHLKLSGDTLHDNWDLKRYKKEFPDSPTVSSNTSKILSEKTSGENNPMHSSKTTEEFRKSNSPFSKEFYIKRGYSEEDAKKEVSEFAKDALKDRNCAITLEFYIDKCEGNIKEAEKLYKERQTTFTLKKCIAKYGEIEGTKKYKERQEKWQNTLAKNGNKCGYSKISQELFMSFNLSNSLYGSHNGELKLFDTNSKMFLYDFTFKNKIIEYHGDQYHANPRKYKADEMSHPYRKTIGYTAKDIWAKDAYKQKVAEYHGYEVLVIWDSEYKSDKEGTIQKCLDFLQK